MNFVFDLDGTICFKGVPVSSRINDALKDLEAAGHSIIFASARPIRDMLPVLHEYFHHHTLIGGNGALISEEGNITFARSFSPEQVDYIKKLIHDHHATYLIDGEWDYSYTGSDSHPILNNLDLEKRASNISLRDHASIVKVLILSADNKDELLQKLSDLDVVIHMHGQEDVIDISPKGIHKLAAMQQLSGDYIAFGNDANDIQLFKGARHSVMIGHHDELSEYAEESISLKGDYEGEIIRKLRELCDYGRVEKV
ncbi:HAD-IIB family hydrolase [Rossellomorea sp. NS-SX7]|uniref:HAD-IIB family hydrolase n=1 Tax=Rossellomorea sp. NS-SX7 TaxID=3463856 RepID=UPI0040598118